MVSFPTSQDSGVPSFVAGWSFSPRFAVLIDGELAGGLEDERFDNIVVGLVVRYSPAPRVWVEAGPAFGQLEYRYDINSFEQGITDTAARVEGEGLLAAVGFEIARKPTWRVDAQARVGMVWVRGAPCDKPLLCNWESTGGDPDPSWGARSRPSGGHPTAAARAVLIAAESGRLVVQAIEPLSPAWRQ